MQVRCYPSGMEQLSEQDEAQARWRALKMDYRGELRRQYESRPDLHRKIFRPKSGQPSFTPMQFSMTLLDYAGGIWDLLRDWEVEDA